MDDYAYENARERVAAKLGFYTHLAVYAVVGLLLVGIDVGTSPGETWVQWPLLGWGIGVLFHALGVFVVRGRPALADRMIERELGQSSRERRPLSR